MSTSTPVARPPARRRRRLYPAVVAVVAALGLLSSAAGAQDGASNAAARHGAAWLVGQFDAGLPLENFGAPDWGVTLDAALGVAATGTGAQQLAVLWEAVVAERDTIAAPFGEDSPGRLARMILLARALGEDPRSVGDGADADLVDRLEALRRDAGADTGLFGAADPTFDGAFRQGFALVALAVSGGEVDPSSVAWLEAQQCDDDFDGAWMPYREDLATPCAFDADRFVGPDTNSTAIAVAALAVVADTSGAIDDGLAWLLEVRNDDGGWGFYPGDASEPSSTAFGLQVLLALGSDDVLVEGAWAALASFQLGCDAPEEDRGALTFPGSNDAPNLFSTAQALPGLAGATIDATPVELVAGVEPLDCSEVPGPPAPGPTPGGAPGPAAPAGVPSPDGVAAGDGGVGAGGATGAGAPGTADRQLALTGLDHWLLALSGASMLVGGIAVTVLRRRIA